MSIAYIFSLDLPFSKKKLYYRELTSKEQLLLCKAMNMYPLDGPDAVEFGEVARSLFRNCVRDVDIFDELNIIEYYLFISKLRMVSVGDTLEILISKENSEFKQIKTTVTISKFVKNLYLTSQKLLDNDEVYGNIESALTVYLNWPSLTAEDVFLKGTVSLQSIFNAAHLYLQKLKIAENVLVFKTDKEREYAYEKLPAGVHRQIQLKIVETLKAFEEVNLFEMPGEVFLKFSYYNLSAQNLVRMFFAENLSNIYNEYYALASRHISPLYVDGITIGERAIYIQMLENEQGGQEKESTETEESQIMDLNDNFNPLSH